jgi:RsiW-degrading membrane proteinase PrsW (M82 family)
MNIRPLPPKNNPEVLLLPPATVPGKWRLLAPLLALGGGILGILGAAFTEFFHGTLLAPFFGAPIIEEALKPTGVYILLARWPRVLAFKSQLYTAFLTALAGLVFGLIENLVYFNIYIDNPSSQVVLWRYTVSLGVHVVCSFIFGLGLNQKLMASIKGYIKFLSTGKRYFFTAMALHAVYNITVTVLQLGFGFLKDS